MATYKQISGTKVQNFSSDPSTALEGQVWYNSTDTAYRSTISQTAAWSTGGNLNTGRHSLGGGGTGQDASLVFGGRGEPPNPKTANTEEYNGTAWTEVNNLGTARYGVGGAGNQTAGLAFGGFLTPGNTTASESWNGSSWTSTNSMVTGARFPAGAGTATSALGMGRSNPGVPSLGIVEQWDGTNWSEITDMNTARVQGVGAGASNTSALYAGGESPAIPGVADNTELWNGSAWKVSDLNTARNGIRGAGIATAAVAFGGNEPAQSGKTEQWNGTSWTETVDMSTARDRGAAGPMGTSTSSMMAGGTPPNGNPATEEFAGAGLVTKTFTTS